MKAKDLWEEFLVSVTRDGKQISLCGLCGNCGEIDTTNSAVWQNQKFGVKTFCICPNGRAMKKAI